MQLKTIVVKLPGDNKNWYLQANNQWGRLQAYAGEFSAVEADKRAKLLQEANSTWVVATEVKQN